MNYLIVNIVFGILTAIFFTGIVIAIGNAVKIARFNNIPLKEENPIKLAYIKTEIQNKLLPLIPALPVLRSTSLNPKLVLLLIHSKTATHK